MSNGGTPFGPYRLLYTLGVGGMGQVFLASQQGEHGIRRLVAIKRILSHLSRRTGLINLFLDEVRIAAQLNHGNIVQVVDHGCIDGQYYMAMEYVHGENLLEVLLRLQKKGKHLPLDIGLHIACSVCEGLYYAHEKEGMDGKPLGIIHRDVSPQNILLSLQGQVKIADFGVARAAEQTHETLGGELRGKVAYMSPEQAYGVELDVRSDIFSLGVVLYEVLSGRSPFRRKSPMATLEAVRAADPAHLSLIALELPAEVCELVHQALGRDPEARPDSARTMHEQLQRIMRLHNLVVSPFDLADYLRDLFPEATGREPDDDPDETAVGRRADEIDDVEVLERKTLFYLRQRHPSGDQSGPPLLSSTLPPELSTGDVRGPRSLGLRVLAVASIIAAVVVAAIVVLSRDASDPDALDATTTAPPDQRVRVVDLGHHAAVDAQVVDTAGALDLATGKLVIESSPSGAAVHQGRRRLGTTPLTVTLPVGRRELRLRKKGYRAVVKVVEVAAGSAQIGATLQALPSHVYVQSTHACDVTLNGRSAGRTPTTVAVDPGRSALLKCVDEKAGIRVVRRVRGAPGQTTQVKLHFGALSINVEPWAKVTIDGKRRGTTPLRILLPSGEHRLLLENPKAGRRKSLTVTIRPRQARRISHW